MHGRLSAALHKHRLDRCILIQRYYSEFLSTIEGLKLKHKQREHTDD